MVQNKSKICFLVFLSNTSNYWNKKLFFFIVLTVALRNLQRLMRKRNMLFTIYKTALSYCLQGWKNKKVKKSKTQWLQRLVIEKQCLYKTAQCVIIKNQDLLKNKKQAELSKLGIRASLSNVPILVDIFL